jgi:hypothetical protein
VKARHLKLMLCAFKQFLGLKINFHKNELFCNGEAKEMQDVYSMSLDVKVGHIHLDILEFSCIIGN